MVNSKRGSLRVKEFNLDITLKSGQVFGWKKVEDWWIGEINGKIIKIRQINDKIEYEIIYGKEEKIKKEIKKYFTLDIPPKKMREIYRKLSRDKILKKAIKEFYGLRIIRQEPWYCTSTFICTSFSNIPRIEKIIENIKKTHGKMVGDGLFLFPSIEDIKRSDKERLRRCGLGFRDKYLHEISKCITYDWFSKIKKMKYKDAKKALMGLPGIGEKIADCILLFSFGFGESFPIDVWIKRVMIKFYGNEIREFLEKRGDKKPINKITEKDIREFAKWKWNGNAGLAQQFLYVYGRKHKIK